MDQSEKLTFSLTVSLTFVIIVSTLIIFMLTPSPVSPTRILFGYITGVYTKDKTVYLNFDQAQWLTDKNSDYAATTACIQDGNCPQCALPPTKSCIPNDYYIKNSDRKTVAYPVAPFVKIGTMLLNTGWVESDPESRPYKNISLSEFLNIFVGPESDDSWIRTAAYDLTVIGGRVIIINQRYIP